MACPSGGAGWSHTAIECILPPGEGLNQAVVVTRAGESTNGAVRLSYNAPTIASVSPAAGDTQGGYPVTLTGTNFGTRTASVATINGVACPITFVAHTSLICTVPASAGGTNLVVTVQIGGQSTSRPDRGQCAAPRCAEGGRETDLPDLTGCA